MGELVNCICGKTFYWRQGVLKCPHCDRPVLLPETPSALRNRTRLVKTLRPGVPRRLVGDK